MINAEPAGPEASALPWPGDCHEVEGIPQWTVTRSCRRHLRRHHFSEQRYEAPGCGRTWKFCRDCGAGRVAAITGLEGLGFASPPVEERQGCDDPTCPRKVSAAGPRTGPR
jgi:hypothetical protein